MKSPYNFVIEPLGSRYNNVKDVDGKSLILNTEIYHHDFVNRLGVVKSVPHVLNNSGIQVGDTVVVHHNVFRRWHDIRGDERNSKCHFNDKTYVVGLDQVFLYNNGEEWKAPKGFCFVQPIKSSNKLSIDIEHETKGIVKYTDGSFDVGELVGFEPFSKYEFVIDGEKLYRVYSKFITIKYEYQGNEEAYNPSWAQSS